MVVAGSSPAGPIYFLQMEKLSLTLEGKVSSSSEILIIDPCYLEGFNWDESVQEVEKAWEAQWRKQIATEREALEAEGKWFDALGRIPTEKDLFGSFVNEVKGLRERVDDLRKKTEEELAKLKAVPKLIAPYFAQGKDYVLVHTPCGDGVYPVIETPKGFEIVYDFPILPTEGGWLVDEAKLSGKLAGYSCVDSGLQVIIDAKKVRIRDDLDKNRYTLFQATREGYVCKFGVEKESFCFEKI